MPDPYLRRSGRARADHRVLAVAIACLALAALLTLHVDASQPADPGDAASRAWDHHLETGEAGAPREFALLALSGDGRVLVAGTDAGDVLFLHAATGEAITTLHGSGDGAVVGLDVDLAGNRAVAVTADGLVDAVDARQGTPLLPPGEGLGTAAAISGDGTFLVVAGDGIRLYRALGSPPGAHFSLIASATQTSASHLYLHPVLPVLAALDDEGRLTVYTYSENSLVKVQGPSPLPDIGSPPIAVAVSRDGGRLAVMDAAGWIHRYAIELEGTSASLVLDHAARLRHGTPQGLQLSADGARIMAWSEAAVLWSEGRNENVEAAEAALTRAATETLRPPLGSGDRFGAVVASANLSHMLLSQLDETGRALPHVYAFPGALPGGAFTRDRVDAGPIALAPDAGLAFGTFGPRLAAYDIDAVHFEAPGAAPFQGDAPFTFLGLSPLLLLAAGASLILLLVVLVAVLVVAGARRGEEQRILAALELDEGPLAPSSAPPSLPRGGGAARSVRPVMPSAPAEAPPPEGIFVLSGFTVAGSPRLNALTLTLARPGVVRVVARREHLTRFAAALEGPVGATGVAAAGGADRSATPLLFSRHLQAGLPVVDDVEWTSRTLHAQKGKTMGVPLPVVARRLAVDLGWMGQRLDRPYRELTALEQWKLRLALAFLHRPRVLLLARDDTPPLDAPGTADAVRRVLSAVARHYGAVILLLDPDDKPLDERVVRAWAHEEVRLTPQGFRERVLLVDGRPVAAPAAAPPPTAPRDDARRAPRRSSRSAAGTRATRKK